MARLTVTGTAPFTATSIRSYASKARLNKYKKPKRIENVDTYTDICQNSRVIICATPCAVEVKEQLAIRAKLEAAKLQYKMTKHHTMKSVLQNTAYEKMLPIFMGQTILIYSNPNESEEEKTATRPEQFVAAAVNVLKEHNRVFLLGGLVEEEMLDNEQIVQLAAMAPYGLDGMRAQLVGSLQLPSQMLAMNLEKHVESPSGSD